MFAQLIITCKWLANFLKKTVKVCSYHFINKQTIDKKKEYKTVD